MSVDVRKICDALGNETRYQLIKALRDKEIITCCDRIELHENGISVADVVQLTGLAQSTVSRHLAVLEECGLIYKEKREQWSCLFLNEETIGAFIREFTSELLPGSSCSSCSP